MVRPDNAAKRLRDWCGPTVQLRVDELTCRTCAQFAAAAVAAALSEADRVLSEQADRHPTPADEGPLIAVVAAQEAG